MVASPLPPLELVFEAELPVVPVVVELMLEYDRLGEWAPLLVLPPPRAERDDADEDLGENNPLCPPLP